MTDTEQNTPGPADPAVPPIDPGEQFNEQPDEQPNVQVDEQSDEKSIGVFGMLIGFVLSLGVLGSGAWGAWWLYTTGPEPKQRKPRPNVTLVEVEHVSPSTRRVVIHAMGTVVPARQVVLQPRVKGEIVKVSTALIPGGILRANEFVLQIDRTDYALLLKQRQSEVARAELAWQLELGQQTIALSEYELLDKIKPIDGPDKALILRVPHLAAARAALAAAKATKEQADLDWERTEISAPFNATVMVKHVDVATQVSTTTKLATLVGTDEYWIQVSLPVGRLKWLTIPKTNGQPGSSVRVYSDTGWGKGVYREGHVTRLMGDIIKEGRMARVLVTVPDPLALKARNAGKSSMLLGDLLRVEIDGTQLENVFDIKRTALRDGKEVWILNSKGELEIRPVKVAWSDRNRALIRSGLSADDKLITSDLTMATKGMKLSTGKPKPTSRPTSGPASRPTSGPTSRPTSGPASRPASGPATRPAPGGAKNKPAVRK